MRSRKPHRRSRRTRRAKVQKKTQNKKIKINGGNPYGVYSYTTAQRPDGSSKQLFDIFMEKIKSVKIISRGLNGITLLVESESSPYKTNKLLFKLSLLDGNMYIIIDNEKVKGVYTNEELHKMTDDKYKSLVEEVKKGYKESGLPEIITERDKTIIGQIIQNSYEKNSEILSTPNKSFEKEYTYQEFFYKRTILTEIGSSENYALCPKPYYHGKFKSKLEELIKHINPTKIESKILSKWNKTDNEVGIIAMEYLESYSPLTKIIDENNPTNYCLYIGMAIYASIQLAIACGIVHNDLQLTNIMVDTSQQYFGNMAGRVMIIDFGLSTHIDKNTYKRILEEYKENHLYTCLALITNLNSGKKSVTGQNFNNSVLKKFSAQQCIGIEKILNDLKSTQITNNEKKDNEIDEDKIDDKIDDKIVKDEKTLLLEHEERMKYTDIPDEELLLEHEERMKYTDIPDEECKRLGYNCNSLFSLNKPKCREKCKNHQISLKNREKCKKGGIDCFSRFKWNAEGCKKECAEYIENIELKLPKQKFERFKKYLYFMKDNNKIIHELLCNKLFVQYLLSAGDEEELKILVGNNDNHLFNGYIFAYNRFSDYLRDKTKPVELDVLDNINIEDIQKEMNCHKFLYENNKEGKKSFIDKIKSFWKVEKDEDIVTL